MDAYAFTRFEADRTHMLDNPNAYDLDVIARDIMNEGIEYEGTPAYEDAKSVFIELTMSCDENEASQWMNHWMCNAIAYRGIEENWKAFYMAAYDIQQSIPLC